MFDMVVVSSKDLYAVLWQENHFSRFKRKEIHKNTRRLTLFKCACNPLCKME